MHSSVEPILNMRLVFDLIHITMQYCNFKIIPILIMLLIKTSTGKILLNTPMLTIVFDALLSSLYIY